MLDEATATTVGTPNEATTHWGISLIVQGKPKRLEHPNDLGATIGEWPLEDLSVEEVRSRWGSGVYRCHWFALDPQAEEPAERRRAMGHGRQFTVVGDPAAVVAPRPAAAAPVVGGDMGHALAFATQILDLAERRASMAASAPTPPANTEIAQALAQVAELRARLDNEAAQRTIEAAHRRELDERDRQIAALRRRAEEAEEEEDDPSIVAPEGSGFLAQLGAGIANAIVEATKKDPQLVMGILSTAAGPVLAKIAEAQGGAPATGNPAPRQVAPAPPPVVVEPEPMTSNGMPSSPMSAAEPAPSAAPAAVAAVVEKTRSGVPITRANGAAPKPAPAVIDVVGETVTQ